MIGIFCSWLCQSYFQRNIIFTSIINFADNSKIVLVYKCQCVNFIFTLSVHKNVLILHTLNISLKFLISHGNQQKISNLYVITRTNVRPTCSPTSKVEARRHIHVSPPIRHILVRIAFFVVA